MQEFDAIAIQLMPQPDSIRPYAIVKVVLFSAAKAIEEERDRLLDKDYGARLALLLNHGHDAPYTDDGELQCAECRPNWDYRRLPIKTLIFQLVGLHKEEVDRLKAELALEKQRNRCGEAVIRENERMTKELAEARKIMESDLSMFKYLRQYFTQSGVSALEDIDESIREIESALAGEEKL